MRTAGRSLDRDDRLSQKAFGLRIKEPFPDIGISRKVRYSDLRLKTEDDE